MKKHWSATMAWRVVKLLAIDLRHFFTNVETKKLCNGLSNQWEDLAQKKVLPSLKQSSTNQPLLVRGPAESHDRSAFFTHFFGACLSLSLSLHSVLVQRWSSSSVSSFSHCWMSFPEKGDAKLRNGQTEKGWNSSTFSISNFCFIPFSLLTFLKLQKLWTYSI